MIRAVDWVAHLLHAPTMLGRRHARHRWHHRIHLIPGSWLGPVCDRYDRRLGVDEDEMHRMAADWANESLQIAEEILPALAELDTTEAEFDAMMAAGEPVVLADRPIGYRCDHITMTTAGPIASVVTGPCWHGCVLQPYYLTTTA